MISLDPVILARIQFAFTISFHIIFPATSIGLASFLAVVEWRLLSSKDQRYRAIYDFWVKIFAVTFAMGVVSGVVMSYELGTNWSVFSDRVGNVLGPLLGYEVLTAFFLEASFLGIMLFGWKRVSQRMHFASTCIVAIGTLISAFWILAANSWMQTPQGFTIGADGRLYPSHWLAIIFNPSFPYRFVHMVAAAYLTTAFVVGGVAGLYLWQKRHIAQSRIMLGMAVLLIALLAPLQIIIGDMSGLVALKYQPAKIAAVEGIWHTQKGVPLNLVGWPDQQAEKTKYSIEIPKMASIILTHHLNGEIKGLTEWAKEDRPPVLPVFWSFRVMVGLGLLMVLIALLSLIQYFRGKLFTSRWLHLCWVVMMPSGFIALLAGWFVNEIGRQPYVAYGIIRTAKAVSPALVGPQVLASLLGFVVVYACIFGAASYYIIRLIRKGVPESGYYEHSREAAVIETRHRPKGV